MEERALARGQGTVPEGLPESDGKLRAKTEGSGGDGTRKAKGRYGRKAGSVGRRAWDKERATWAGWPALSTFREGTETPPELGPTPNSFTALSVQL